MTLYKCSIETLRLSCTVPLVLRFYCWPEMTSYQNVPQGVVQVNHSSSDEMFHDFLSEFFSYLCDYRAPFRLYLGF